MAKAAMDAEHDGLVQIRVDMAIPADRSDVVCVELSFYLQPVCSAPNVEYTFPNRVTAHMRDEYKCPAIYLWLVLKNLTEDPWLVYIGETDELCPRRVNGYINPGRSQKTNQRLNALFREYLGGGFVVRLEVMRLERLKLGAIVLSREDLRDKHVRVFLEELLCVHYSRHGYTLLNASSERWTDK